MASKKTQPESLGMFGKLRDALEGLAVRAKLANIAGHTFGHKRDLYKALGYKRELEPLDYRSRYRRNEVANRIVKAAPKATWRGGCDIVEDENLEVVTAFEQACIDLDQRLKFWKRLYQVDVLSRIGRYGVLLIGAPGRLDQPLSKLNGLNDVLYLTPFAEEDARIQFYEIDPEQPRFGLPVMYLIKRTNLTDPTAVNQASVGRPVHWTRVIHISEGQLDDRVFGEPVLESVWNRLDDLEKIVGAGAEAFWRRADGGNLLTIDPTLEFDEKEAEDAKKQLDEWEHGLRKNLTMRGAKWERLGADIASMKAEVDSVMSLISAGCGIPQRVLMGSEQGKLAAKQDRATWDNQITDRQNDYAGPMMVRPLIDRLVTFGALPTPVNGPEEYEVKWSAIQTMDDEQRATVAGEWAGLNKTGGPIIVLPNEVREKVLNLPPLEEVTPDGNDPNEAWLSQPIPSPDTPAGTEVQDPNEPGMAYSQTTQDVEPPAGQNANDPTSAKPVTTMKRKGGADPAWKHIHAAADRFRPSAKLEGLRRLRAGQGFYDPRPARGRRRGQE